MTRVLLYPLAAAYVAIEMTLFVLVAGVMLTVMLAYWVIRSGARLIRRFAAATTASDEYRGCTLPLTTDPLVPRVKVG
ncbi:hypothetical protein [Agromyces seonyuensis]|uniref:TLC domain-containing protein n=1 Tax=Agromyces seonyuensis TaxID=2662446 RepID=A0A6I4P2L3_9MICO|nr:hypothetical protein [Agromyces seonyuensis]MWB97537.1 hypothetical protein [Agromyces seonyuensis]